jgi:hypothetical protein
MTIKKLLFNVILILLFNGFIFGQEQNPNVISDYNKNLIQIGEIIPFNLLEKYDKAKYDIIIIHLPENYNVNDYYFDVGISLVIDNNQEYFNIESYYESKNLPQFKNIEIEYIHYNIIYYERLFNKYNGYRGDPTGKCFTILFDKDNKFVKKIGVR